MKKPYTDVDFTPVSGPTRYELHRWFKASMLVLAALFVLAIPVWKFNVAHRFAPEVVAPIAPQVQPVR